MAHVSNRLRFLIFLLSYFLLKMVSVMNKLHCHKKIVAYFLDKNSQMAMICYNYKINNLQITLYTSGNVLDNCWCFKGVPKNFTNFARKHLCQIKCDPESLIYLCSLHLHYKRGTCTQLLFSEFCRILKNTFLLPSNFIFDI